MIDPELAARLTEIQSLAEKAYHAAESTRKYLFWTSVVTVVLFVLPLIGLAFVAPQFLSSYTNSLSGLGF
jgi:type II secretory pathway component PulF